MKRLYLIPLLCIALLLVSCNSDDDSNDGDSDDFNLVGVWEGQSVDFDTTAVVEIGGEEIPIICDGEGFDIDFRITFTEDPNEYSADGTFSVLNDCTFIGEQTQEDLEVFGDGTWTYENGDLIMMENGQTITVEVDVVSDNLIVIEFEEDIILEEGPISAEGSVEVEIELQRN